MILGLLASLALGAIIACPFSILVEKWHFSIWSFSLRVLLLLVDVDRFFLLLTKSIDLQ